MQEHKKRPLNIFAILLLSIVAGCSQDEILEGELITRETIDVSEEEKAKFAALGFDVSDMVQISETNPLCDDCNSKQYLLEGDIVIDGEDLEAMLTSDVYHVGAVGEQYRTTNLVKNNQIIRILGYTGTNGALDSKMRSGLQMAVANFNALDLGLSFVLHFGTNSSAYDITVMRINGLAGGSSGFPRNGEPYPWVKVYAGTSTYGVDVIEHVITHELGHALGLRHTDYFNRSLSCGYGGNEGLDGVGAVRVPGTPSGYDPFSVMLSCFKANATGEFGFYDKAALEYLY